MFRLLNKVMELADSLGYPTSLDMGENYITIAGRGHVAGQKFSLSIYIMKEAENDGT